MTLGFFIICAALLFSVILNGFCFWYVKNLISDLSYVVFNVNEFKEEVEQYEEHLRRFLNLEAYSEEPTVKNLFQHTEDTLENFNNRFVDYLEAEEEGGEPIDDRD
jgi:predicted PurR-regulated permease PerM